MALQGDGQMPKGTGKLDFIPIPWQQAIVQWKMHGKTNEEIVYLLKKKYKYNVHAVTLGKWLRTRTDAAPNQLFKRESYVNELEGHYIEILRDFKKLSEFTWKTLRDTNDASRNGDGKARADVLKIIGELRTQIELANSLMGALPKTDEQIENTAKSVGKALQELDKMGLINKFEQSKKDEKKAKEKAIDDSPLAREVEIELEGGGTIKKKVGIDNWA